MIYRGTLPNSFGGVYSFRALDNSPTQETITEAAMYPQMQNEVLDFGSVYSAGGSAIAPKTGNLNFGFTVQIEAFNGNSLGTIDIWCTDNSLAYGAKTYNISNGVTSSVSFSGTFAVTSGYTYTLRIRADSGYDLSGRTVQAGTSWYGQFI